MNVKKTTLLILMILLLFPVLVLGNSSIINIGINGEKVSVLKAPIIRNGKLVDSSTPSFVYIDRTLTPVRELAESSGAEVLWDNDTRKVTLVTKDSRIELFIDRDTVIVNGEEERLDKNSIPRLASYPTGETVTVLPLSFIAKSLGYRVGWDDEVKAVNMTLEEDPAIEEKEERPETNPVPEKGKNTVKSIKMEVIEGEDYLVVENTDNVNFNTIELKNPDRIAIDILDSELEGGTFFSYDYKVGVVKGVRVSQFSPDNNYSKNDRIVRLVLDMDSGIVNPRVDIKKEANKIYIKPEKDLWKAIDYSEDGQSRILLIEGASPLTSYKYDGLKKTMTISLPKEDLRLQVGKKDLKDPLGESITVKESPGSYEIELKFRRSVIFREEDSRDGFKLVINKDTNIKNSDRIIVIDPGHGGSQPGAISPNKTRETDLNLSLSLKLKNALEAKGYTVVMTRDKEVTLGLYERADLANSIYADLFISIHANAMANNPNVKGIEVLYAPASDTVYNKEKKDFAKFLQDELIKATGATNRGIKERPNLVVVRETKMPSALVEMGFLTNPEEERLISSPQYQDLLASGIVKGVEKYFLEY